MILSGGPCPQLGKPHRDAFMLYALDIALDLRPCATNAQVLQASRGYGLGETQLVDGLRPECRSNRGLLKRLVREQ